MPILSIGERKQGAVQAGRKDTGGEGKTTLTKSAAEEKIASGRCRHEIKTIGSTSGRNCVKKYVIDLQTEPVITEIRIYADGDGVIRIPPEYRSDVTYGANVKAPAVSLYSEGG